MTLEERLAAATAALEEADFLAALAPAAAEAALRAAVPELFTDPAHWLAPHEATDAMLAEAELFEFGVNETRVAYGVLRNAYLGRGRPPSDEYRAYVAYLGEEKAT